MLDQLKSFLSKKLASLAVVVGLIENSGADARWKVGGYALLGAAYLVGQALVDRAKVGK